MKKVFVMLAFLMLTVSSAFASAGPVAVDVSVDAVDKDPLMQVYLERLVQIIQSNFKLNGNMDISRDARAAVQFTVDHFGGISAVVLKKSSGNEVWDNLSMRAIQISKVPELPPNYRGSRLVLQFAFYPNNEREWIDYGTDAVYTDEVLQASSLNPVGFVDMDPLMQVYLERLKQIIMSNFNPPSNLNIPRDAKTTVQFTVDRFGGISAIVLKNSSGDNSWDALSMRAIRISKLPELPPNYRASSLVLHFNFTPN